MCCSFLFDTKIPECGWIQDIPDYCFEHSSTQIFKSERFKKPVYIVENHAGAIKAWYEQRIGAPALITFDKHTDTFLPFLRYRNTQLGYNDDKLLAILESIKAEIDSLNPDDFFRNGKYLHAKQNSSDCKLWNDEHISLALYLGLIHKAYICAPSVDRPYTQTDNPKLKALYNDVEYCHMLINKSICIPHIEGVEGIVTAANNLAEHLNQDLRNETMDLLARYAFPNECDFILDIDLDFLLHPFFQDMNWDRYTTFFKLVRNAQAITIATETSCVQESCIYYNSAINSYNKEANKYNLPTFPNIKWDSRNALNGVLNLIDFELSGRRNEEESKHDSLYKSIQSSPFSIRGI